MGNYSVANISTLAMGIISSASGCIANCSAPQCLEASKHSSGDSTTNFVRFIEDFLNKNINIY
jgi:hypothetical protein